MTMKVTARTADITRDAARSNRNGRERRVLVSIGSSAGDDDYPMLPVRAGADSGPITARLFAVSDVFRQS
jgi:hypothetical protein